MIRSTKHWSSYPVFKSFVCDVFIAGCSLPTALALRMGADVLEYSPVVLLFQWLAFMGVASGVLIITGFSRRMWRYVSVNDLFSMAQTVVLCEILFVPCLIIANQYNEFP